MNRIGVLLFALLLSGGFCLLLAMGHALFSMICRICRPLEEWRERGIELLERQVDEE